MSFELSFITGSRRPARDESPTFTCVITQTNLYICKGELSYYIRHATFAYYWADHIIIFQQEFIASMRGTYSARSVDGNERQLLFDHHREMKCKAILPSFGKYIEVKTASQNFREDTIRHQKTEST